MRIIFAIILGISLTSCFEQPYDHRQYDRLEVKHDHHHHDTEHDHKHHDGHEHTDSTKVEEHHHSNEDGKQHEH